MTRGERRFSGFRGRAPMYKILVVDDEALMVAALEQMIAMIDGFMVCATARNGLEAIEAREKYDPDIIIMDVIMPDMNGIAAGKAIRKVDSHVAIYLISAYNEFDYAKEAIKIKVSDYLLKPLSFTVVKRVLEEYRGLNKQRDATFEEICSILETRDYKTMYYKLPDIVKSIMEESWDSAEEIIDYYYKIEAKLIRTYGCSQSTSYINKPTGEKPPMAKWLSFRLYAMMDLILRTKAMTDYPVMEKVFSCIDAHLEENIGLKEVKTYCDLSQGYLSRLFKRTLGISVMDYIHLCHMMYAKWLFCTQGMSVIDVAYKLSYNESSYFSKIFKKYEYMTVSEYKKKIPGSGDE